MDRALFAVTQWEKEIPGPDYRPMALLGRLAEVALTVRRDHLEPLFAGFGLQAGEFDVLATLRRAGAPYRLSPTVLFEATMMSSGGMTARLDRLEKAGWVARGPNPQDRRGTLVELTFSGKALIEKALVSHLANQTRIVGCLDSGEQEALVGLLGKLLAGVQAVGREENS
ncbi:MAG: MarR family winged helix-turn-helix transcriptional regulator [Paracoccaceae bacterium]